MHRQSIIIRPCGWLLWRSNASYNETRRPMEKPANNNARNQTLEFERCCFYCRHTGRGELVQNCPRSTLTTQHWPSVNRSTCERYFTLDLRKLAFGRYRLPETVALINCPLLCIDICYIIKKNYLEL